MELPFRKESAAASKKRPLPIAMGPEASGRLRGSRVFLIPASHKPSSGDGGGAGHPLGTHPS